MAAALLGVELLERLHEGWSHQKAPITERPVSATEDLDGW
jgi:hypothetical protein